MDPVDVPQVVVGTDARVALMRDRAALLDANSKLQCSKDWYALVRKSYTH